MTISARVSELFSDFGDCAALDCDGRPATWADLSAVAAGIDDLLTAAGVPTAAPVAVVLRHSPGPIAAVVGGLGARRCSVLLNPLLGDGDLAAEIAAAPVAAVVATEADWARPGLAGAVRKAGLLAIAVPAAETGAPVVVDGTVPQGTAASENEALSGAAVTVLTSGTTGTAKRVPVPWARLDSLPGGKPPPDPRSARGVTINSLPLHSIGGVLGLAATIWRGRPLAVMDHFDVKRWAALVGEHQPRRAGAPPAVLRMILDAAVPPADLASLTCFETGSAPTDPAVVAEFEAVYGIPVLVSYGATEFLAAVTTWTLEDWREWSPAKRGSVGRVVPGFEIRVVDGRLEVRNARSDGDWIATNDVARIDSDGFLWIDGRADDVVNRGGFKVSPEKVARILEEHPAVAEAAVVGLDDERLGQVPAAVVAAGGNVAPDEAALLVWARERLAPYEVPVRIVVVDTLPRNAMLKVATAEIRRLLNPDTEASR